MSFEHLSTDSDLVAKSIRGDKQAFGQLYERYLDQIYRYIFYRVSDHGKAEDITQTVFVKAWEKLPAASHKKEISNFRAWVYRIAHNAVIDFYRSRKKTVPLEQLNITQDHTPGPDVIVQENETGSFLTQAVSQLDENLQQVIILRFVNQLSHEAVAQIMGLSDGHVRVLQHRALQKIRDKLLEREGQDE